MKLFSSKLMLLLCYALFCAANAIAQGQGYIDSKNGDTFSSWTMPTLTLGGWAASADGTPASSVTIFIDGKSIGTVAPTLSRPDVAAYLNNTTYTLYGWTFSYSAGTKLTPGGHTLSALGYDSHGSAFALGYAGVSPSVTILTPQPPQGYVDGVASGTVTQAQSIVLNGWAGDPQDGAPVNRVQVFIDGASVGNAQIGQTRSDVANVYPNYLRSGWSFTYNATNLAGSHTFTAIAYDNEGLSTTLPVDGPNTVNVLAPDLTETGIVIVSGTPTSGGTIGVSDTTNNVGNGSAGTSYTHFFLNTSPVKGGTLVGTRVVSTIVAGGNSISPSTSLTLPLNLNGSYYVVACANDVNTVTESNTANDCSATTQFTLAMPDLTETSVALIGGPAIAGGSIKVSDTANNIGSGNAVASWTRFYLNTTAAKGGTVLGTRAVPTLAGGANSISAGTTFTLPLNLNGTYYVVACANDTNSVTESSTTNNCTPTTSFSIGGADLTESGMSLSGTVSPGASVNIGDTTSNIGTGNATTSWTRFYLNKTAVKGGTLIGTRAVPTLVAGANSVSNSTTLNIPANIAGAYYIVGCANDTGSVTESNTTNDCASIPVTVLGADLVVSQDAVGAGAASPGETIGVSEITTNTGATSAASSTTRFYFSSSLNLAKSGSGAAVVLGSRSVPALAASASSLASTLLTIPASAAPGIYYLFACANDTGTIPEYNTTNNCLASPVVVFNASAVVHVDQNSASAADTSCGTTAVPCKTITEGLAAATAGQTVVVESGTYVEQLTINKNVVLTARTRYQATVQAPGTLLADPASGFMNIVTVAGDATNVSILSMMVMGPGPSSCGSIHHGIFVENANATIAGNEFYKIRDNPYSGCQNGVAVRFGSRALGFTGHSGAISYNTVLDYNKGGIVVDGDGTNVNIVGNRVTGQSQTAINGQNGIQISRGAKGLVDSNTVSNNRYGTTPLGTSAAGILVYDITNGVTVTNNAITGNDEGIGIYSDSTAATNVTVKTNTSNGNAITGIHVDANSSGNTIWNNVAQGNGTYDAADEHPDLTFNDWGVNTPNQNTLGPGTINVGLFTF